MQTFNSNDVKIRCALRAILKGAPSHLILLFSFLFSTGLLADGRTDINNKYQSLGGAGGFLGAATTGLSTTPDKKGRYIHYQGGSIYWHPKTGAHVIYGAIKQKWKNMGWETSALGYPSTDERSTPDGIGRYNHFTGWVYQSNGNVGGPPGSIYWTPSTGAHWLAGPVRDKWAAHGWEKGPLGYPTSDLFNGSNGHAATNFQNGQIKHKTGPGLSVLSQNMGFLVAPASYGGESENRAFWALVKNLRQAQPDVVALQEMFVNSRRDQLRNELKDLYPNWITGPDENDLESDGGLMILSKYPIVAHDQIIFRQCGAEDCFANKGAIYIRIQTPLGFYDIFNTHTQNPDPDFGGNQQGVVQTQLNALYSFISAKRGSKQVPAIVTGDFNTNGLNNSLYNDMMIRLGQPIDTWKTIHPNGKGITSDNVANFEPGDSQPAWDQRGKSGERLDYIFYYPGARYQSQLTYSDVVMWQTDTYKDLSDHYGVWTWLGVTEESDVVYNKRISRVQVKLTGFHALEVTDGAVNVGDADEVEWRIGLNVDNQNNYSAKSRKYNGIDNAEYFAIDGPSVSGTAIDNFIEISVEGTEIDDVCVPIFGCAVTGRASLGKRTLKIWREQLYEAIRSPQRYGLGMMRGAGGEYVGYVEVRAFQ